jgi:CRP-like cAMP-binding protein
LLEHPWVKGTTARTNKIADSDKRLSAYRRFKTTLEAKVFADMVALSDNLSPDDVARKTSLIERSFQMLNPDHRGYVTTKTLQKLTKERIDSNDEEGELSLSGFSDLLAENLKNKYYPKGHVIYREGDKGNAMYFINSGSVEVYTKDGAKSIRIAGDCFGEGALLHPKKIRSATIRCVTPVHAIEISREYFEKYMASDEGTNLQLREKDKFRKRQRAKTILQLQKNMSEVDLKKGEYAFRIGEEGNELYIIEEGKVDVLTEDKALVLSLKSGEMMGEQSLIFGRPRNVDAQCVSDSCRLHVMSGRDFYKLLDTHPSLRESIRDIGLRREFQKAICARTGKPFPKTEAQLREAFNAVDTSKNGAIELRELRTIINRFDPHHTEDDIREMLETLDLDKTGKVHWAEFKKMFGMLNSS